MDGEWNLVNFILKVNPSANVESEFELPSYYGFDCLDGKFSVIDKALRHKYWSSIKLMIANNPNIDVNTPSAKRYNKGKSILWEAAKYNQWDLVEFIVRTCPTVDVNVFCQFPRQTILVMAANAQQWDLVRLMLHHQPNKDIAVPLMAAREWQWDIVESFLQIHPEIDLNDGFDDVMYGKSILFYLLLHRPQSLEHVIQERGQDCQNYPKCLFDPKISLLWKAAYFNEWDLVNRELDTASTIQINESHTLDEKWPRVHTNASPTKQTILIMAARESQWSTIHRILKKFPESTCYTTYADIPKEYEHLLQRITISKDDDLKKLLVFVNPKGLNSRFWILQEHKGLPNIYQNSFDHTMDCIYTLLYDLSADPNHMCIQFPKDIKDLLTLEILFDEHPELRGIETQFVKKRIADEMEKRNCAMIVKSKNAITIGLTKRLIFNLNQHDLTPKEKHLIINQFQESVRMHIPNIYHPYRMRQVTIQKITETIPDVIQEMDSMILQMRHASQRVDELVKSHSSMNS